MRWHPRVAGVEVGFGRRAHGVATLSDPRTHDPDALRPYERISISTGVLIPKQPTGVSSGTSPM